MPAPPAKPAAMGTASRPANRTRNAVAEPASAPAAAGSWIPRPVPAIAAACIATPGPPTLPRRVRAAVRDPPVPGPAAMGPAARREMSVAGASASTCKPITITAAPAHLRASGPRCAARGAATAIPKRRIAATASAPTFALIRGRAAGAASSTCARAPSPIAARVSVSPPGSARTGNPMAPTAGNAATPAPAAKPARVAAAPARAEPRTAKANAWPRPTVAARAPSTSSPADRAAAPPASSVPARPWR